MNEPIKVAMLPGTFQSHKTVKAAIMDRQSYNAYRGWKLPDDENGADEGYLVEYLDGGEPNDMRHDGYISWTPKKQFDDGYEHSIVPCEKAPITFCEVVDGLKVGKMFTRRGWNGSAMFIFLVPGSQFKVNRPPLLGIFKEGYGIDYRAHIDMKCANGEIVVWTASQSDILSEDWMEVVSVA